MSKRSGNNLIIKLKVSRSMIAVFSLVHVGALALLWAIDAPLWVLIPLAAAIGLSLYVALSRQALRSMHGAVIAMRWDSEEGLSLRRSGTPGWNAAAIRSRFVHPWLVILSIKISGHRIPASLILAADSLEPEVFRRLRAALLAPRRTQAG